MAPRPEFRLQERGSDPATQGRSPSILELSDTKVYEPQMRALLGTASPFCEVVVLKLRTEPTGRIFVTDSYHHCVWVFNDEGQKSHAPRRLGMYGADNGRCAAVNVVNSRDVGIYCLGAFLLFRFSGAPRRLGLEHLSIFGPVS